ncbi:putative ATP-dependent endonuclease of OLD family [Chryseobacterium rhizosphaerae]|uniref:ATP-dependent endonuclease of OLD family n=1 Tax=Chryseobacterium rhizosphaerae TaxID=395937 RepID=A0AAE4C1P2_9FLAO|nr:AAA family ATPase [Chryseobacterium rhizosphaerae]MDR6525693.1 putative ATP-dependent endonuclease of OLD family [Chryseobacterium rhizosphaerae]
MKLKKVEILKYKSFSTTQTFQVEDDITILVGMNESGKTSALEAMGKTNYFQEDEEFKFNLTHDYPRREKKAIDKAQTIPDAIVTTYEIDDELVEKIEKQLGAGIISNRIFSITTTYDNKSKYAINFDSRKFIDFKTKALGIASAALTEKLKVVNSVEKLNELIGTYSDEKYTQGLKTLEKYYSNAWKWPDAIDEYIVRTFLVPNIPKYLYYDEYYALPSRISIEKLEAGELNDNEFKTAKALFELADINTEEILKADSFEDFIAELEATEAIISDELFKYWQTNTNLNIDFQIDKIASKDQYGNTQIVEHVLDIRVKSKGVSLSLKNRSKGFNWFFSFLVWFKKIQEDKDSKYILLLDEPGLNLHASAQADLLKFLADLSANYQIIYTTHSPFMISSENLNRVRTVLETDSGSQISDSIQEKDPNTLFPLQAALGYDIAQNLYVSKKNLLVEGVSDLIILTAMSSILEAEKRTYLRSDVTIVPTGGLEKVATFISLLRGSSLETVCLLDSYTDPKGKAKMDSLIAEKIIHGKKVRFFHDFLDTHDKADLEDIFTKNDYLKLFNAAYTEYTDISEAALNPAINQIIIQINQHLSIPRFNHYRPANQLTKMAVDASFFDPQTLENFEKVFQEINSLFD